MNHEVGIYILMTTWVNRGS